MFDNCFSSLFTEVSFWVVLCMRLSEEFKACSLFFLWKSYKATKIQIKQNLTNKTKINKQKTTKAAIFCAHKNFQKGKSRLFYILVLFYAQNFFLKKINRLEIAIIFFTILPKYTPLNHPIEDLFVHTYFYLWKSPFIHDNLWDSLFRSWSLVRIFLNPSCLWKSLFIYAYL